MIKAKKSLGQNFLIDGNIIKKIVNVIEIKNKTILEVGPGTGNLTTHLISKKPKKIYVVEKDNQLISLLQKNFENQIIIINDDILKLDENLISDDQLIVFGNESHGISQEILSLIKEKITIQKIGEAESLNVAVSAAIILNKFCV